MMILSGKSDAGLRRCNNEDAFIIQPESGFCALADGMGGAACGEIASRIFVETALEVFSKMKEGERCEREIIEAVYTVFMMANERIRMNGKENSERRGMGCTAELLAFYNRHIVLGHVGDSRTYLLRDTLRQLTNDHSLVQEQMNKGIITSMEAKKHRLRNIILRAVGVCEKLEIDLIRGEIMPGDIFLLCSDGLTDMVDEASITRILSMHDALARKAEQLIEAAKAAGGLDNITVILCQVPISE
ncbi:MAG: Stp1/IreP family PP2C-type Ser/Thr phosphatase [bacterium]